MFGRLLVLCDVFFDKLDVMWMHKQQFGNHMCTVIVQFIPFSDSFDYVLHILTSYLEQLRLNQDIIL